MSTAPETIPPPKTHHPLLVPAFAFLLSLGFLVTARVFIGVSLGLFFAPLISATLLVPFLVLAEGTFRRRLMVVLATTLAAAVVWLSALGQLTFAEYLRALLILVVYSSALAGLASMFQRTPLRSTGAAALTIFIASAWLTWPVWLAPWLTERSADLLIPAHPVLVMNASLSRPFPVPWAQHKIAYDLTTLGDDVVYELPHAILPLLFVHLLAAIGLCTTPAARRTALPTC